MADRILEITDLLLGAAHADREYRSDEEATLRRLLVDLLGEAKLPDDVEARIAGFSTASFDVAKTAAAFVGDPASEKRKLLELVAAVRDADDEIDLDEDAYLRALASALGVPDSEITDLVVDYEVEDLRAHLGSLRTPPPIPGKA
jgi:uncharacterized tellurite resistance protein B-like protein